MKIGNIEFRLPWTRYVNMEIEEEIYWAVRKSIGEDIAEIFDDAHCKCTDHKPECKTHNSALRWAAKIARENNDYSKRLL